MSFERLKEFEKYLARDHPEDRNLDHILKILRADEAFSTGPTRGDFEEKQISNIEGRSEFSILPGMKDEFEQPSILDTLRRETVYR
jgi:hypothetical protein